MDCARIDVIGYHFGTHDEPESLAVERHLIECKACLSAYLAIKRHTDHAARAERPSDATRARLRRDVELAFPKPLTQRLRAWLERPIPLYSGVMAATVALLVAVLAPSVAHHAHGRLQDGDRVDTSRRSAESLTTY
jgi:anti-sigma factor RsiW